MSIILMTTVLQSTDNTNKRNLIFITHRASEGYPKRQPKTVRFPHLMPEKVM